MQFTGEYLDRTGLYNLRAREYDPANGDFLTTDPLAPRLQDPYVAAYVYANDRPLVLIDPSGMCGLCDTIGGGLNSLGNVASQGLSAAGNAFGYVASTAYDTVVSPFINSYNCLNGLTNGDFRGATPTCIKAAIGVGTLALLFVPGGEAVDVAGRGLISAGERGLVDRVAAEDGTALARQLGAEGERLSGIDAAAKVRIPSATGTAAYRIPDALTETTLTEVKNVARLGYSNQLQDFAAYASGNGRALNLIVRQNTVLTRGLQDLVDSGEINLIRSLPAR